MRQTYQRLAASQRITGRARTPVHLYPVHTARWNRAEPNRATLYDQSSDTTEPCWKRPTYGRGAAMV